MRIFFSLSLSLFERVCVLSITWYKGNVVDDIDDSTRETEHKKKTSLGIYTTYEDLKMKVIAQRHHHSKPCTCFYFCLSLSFFPRCGFLRSYFFTFHWVDFCGYFFFLSLHHSLHPLETISKRFKQIQNPVCSVRISSNQSINIDVYTMCERTHIQSKHKSTS